MSPYLRMIIGVVLGGAAGFGLSKIGHCFGVG